MHAGSRVTYVYEKELRSTVYALRNISTSLWSAGPRTSTYTEVHVLVACTAHTRDTHTHTHARILYTVRWLVRVPGGPCTQPLHVVTAMSSEDNTHTHSTANLNPPPSPHPDASLLTVFAPVFPRYSKYSKYSKYTPPADSVFARFARRANTRANTAACCKY